MWIGYEAVVMSGVTIGDGAIVGARAIVTKDVLPYTIVGGIPAKPIRKIFSEEVISSLLEIKWWEWPYEGIRENITAIQSGNIPVSKQSGWKDRSSRLLCNAVLCVILVIRITLISEHKKEVSHA